MANELERPEVQELETLFEFFEVGIRTIRLLAQTYEVSQDAIERCLRVWKRARPEPTQKLGLRFFSAQAVAIVRIENLTPPSPALCRLRAELIRRVKRRINFREEVKKLIPFFTVAPPDGYTPQELVVQKIFGQPDPNNVEQLVWDQLFARFSELADTLEHIEPGQFSRKFWEEFRWLIVTGHFPRLHFLDQDSALVERVVEETVQEDLLEIIQMRFGLGRFDVGHTYRSIRDELKPGVRSGQITRWVNRALEQLRQPEPRGKLAYLLDPLPSRIDRLENQVTTLAAALEAQQASEEE